MKTTNNVQKAITKSLAVIISLVLISITVNAQDFWRTVMENNSLSQIAMAMTDNSGASSSSTEFSAANDWNAYAKYAEVEADDELLLEDWMVSDNNFYTSVNVVAETEHALTVESWMTDNSYFNGMASYFKIEKEEPLQIEEWMQNSNYFDVKITGFEQETEKPLELESWMTAANIWNI